METNPFESLAKGIVALLHAKKIITNEEHQILLSSLKSGNPHYQLGMTMEIIADGILRRDE